MKKIIFFLTIFSCIIFGENGNYASIGVNSDSFTGLEIGRANGPEIWNDAIIYYAKINIPLALSIEQKNIDTWEFKLGVKGKVFSKNKLLINGDFNLFMIKHNQVLGTFYPFGYSIKLTPSYENKRGYVGFQTEWNQVITTYIYHSDITKERFEDIETSSGERYISEPENGFYNFTGHSLNYGVETALKSNDKVYTYFEAGVRDYLSKYTSGFDSVMYGQLPFYMSFNINYKVEE